MTESASDSPPRWLAWIPAIALAVMLVGAALTGGGYISTQAEQGRKIEALERRETERQRREAEDREKQFEQMADIRESVIVIKARLDALVPENRREAR